MSVTKRKKERVWLFFKSNMGMNYLRKFQAEPNLVLSVLKEEFIFETNMLQLREGWEL